MMGNFTGTHPIFDGEKPWFLVKIFPNEKHSAGFSPSPHFAWMESMGFSGPDVTVTTFGVGFSNFQYGFSTFLVDFAGISPRNSFGD